MIITVEQTVPAYYGVAYYRWDLHAAVCYPIPLHLIVRWTRNAYFVIKAAHRPDWFVAQLAAAHEEGQESLRARHQIALEREFIRGKEVGWKEGREALLRSLDNLLR
jgi:hypothetical protein